MSDEEDWLPGLLVRLLHRDDVQFDASVVVADPRTSGVAARGDNGLWHLGGHHVEGMGATNPVPSRRLREPDLRVLIMSDIIRNIKHNN